MNIEVHFASNIFDELSLRDKNVIVIDVLRASTTIITALVNGAKEIIPVETIEKAVKVSGNLYGDVVLRGGERNGKLIEGFNLGNSPLEYTEEVVKGKSIIFCSTNGSVTIVKAKYAKNLFICGFPNIEKIVEHIKNLNEDFIILCASKNFTFSFEDAVCAGMIVELLKDENNIILNDGALASKMLYKSSKKSILKMLKDSNHGKFLTEIGMEADLKICAEINSKPIIPFQIDNTIKILN